MLNVLDAIQQHPQVMQPLFLHQEVALTAADVEKLFVAQLSDTGSNFRAVENVVLAFWADYLLDLEGCIC